jgi:hypothetical protein
MISPLVLDECLTLFLFLFYFYFFYFIFIFFILFLFFLFYFSILKSVFFYSVTRENSMTFPLILDECLIFILKEKKIKIFSDKKHA